MESILPRTAQHRFRLTGVGGALVLGLGYAAADYALNHYAFDDGWTIFWPLNGITIALLIMRPRSEWPLLLCGIEVGTGISERLDHNSLSLTLWQRALSLSEVLITASLLPAFSNLNDWLRKPHIFRRFSTAVLLGPGISGVLAVVYFHLAEHLPALHTFNAWAVADALGIAATMPLVLSIGSPELRSLFVPSALVRTLGILALALVCATLALSVTRYPLLFLVYPVLLLVDALLAFGGSALAMCAVCFLAVSLATHSHGPFGVWPPGLFVSRNFALQLYLGFHVLALFPASLRIQERRRIAEELRDANVQLTMLASLDGLTGIANRRALDERFAQEWSRAQRGRTPFTLLMLDIDHFKQFNDGYGHHAGDHALASVAAALAAHIRRPQDMVARFGGEEFAVLLPHTGRDGAAHLAEDLRHAVEALGLPHGGSPWGCVTVSIGGATYLPSAPSGAADRFQLLKAADQALYQAKQSGRNCVEFSPAARELVL